MCSSDHMIHAWRRLQALFAARPVVCSWWMRAEGVRLSLTSTGRSMKQRPVMTGHVIMNDA